MFWDVSYSKAHIIYYIIYLQGGLGNSKEPPISHGQHKTKGSVGTIILLFIQVDKRKRPKHRKLLRYYLYIVRISSESPAR